MIFFVSTLAINQTRYWIEISTYLESLGHKLVFLSFDDESSIFLRKKGQDVFSYSAMKGEALSEVDALEKLCSYGVEEIDYWLTHEQLTFGEKRKNYLLNKLTRSIALFEEAYEAWSKSGKVVLLQELGGFLSVLGLMFAARKNSVTFYFLEPSFFKGRVFITSGGIHAPIVEGDDSEEAKRLSKDYIAESIKKSVVVIPEKDRNSYTSVFKKIFRIKNILRLFDKLYRQYILRRYQEFGYNLRYAVQHLTQFRNEILFRSLYTSTNAIYSKNYIYFPMHVPADVAITLRAFKFREQLAVLESLLMALPCDMIVVIKEHPACIGKTEYKGLSRLLRRFRNLKLISPKVNNYDLVRKCSGVFTINSKAGAEAMLLHKPVVAIGEAFYTRSGLVETPKTVNDAAATLLNICEGEKILTSDLDDVYSFFSKVWSSSVPGELYGTDRELTENFAKAFLDRVQLDHQI